MTAHLISHRTPVTANFANVHEFLRRSFVVFTILGLLMLPTNGLSQGAVMTVGAFKAHVRSMESSALPMFSTDGKAVQAAFAAAIGEERDPKRRSPTTCLPTKVTPRQSMELIAHMKALPASRNEESAIAVIRQWLNVKFRC